MDAEVVQKEIKSSHHGRTMRFVTAYVGESVIGEKGVVDAGSIAEESRESRPTHICDA
jgi:hypothetical protein